ncbi:head fiber protein [Chelativorans sp. AA-79]|uniref:head fiber protein n=1 Tax=Chelativorans sp. AA-79 TaxID=3028735 RepID=UPI0023F742C6|nr:head fiber protein [Chelativorans sp. AA-79]WEX10294.1 head fiber protein [Chelativorans sp. AA-79]
MGFKKFTRPVMAPGFYTEDGAPYDPGEGEFIPLSEKGAAGGVATLDGDEKLSADQLPPLQHETAEAATEAEMLALIVGAPAVCIRTDFTPPHMFYLRQEPASTLSNWTDTGEFGAGAANPSATIGLVAKNGAANTFMRSDGAPALDQGIAPTWTGKHIFSGPSSATEPGFQVRSALPAVDFYDTAGVSNTHRFTLVYDGNRQRVFAKLLNDDGSDLMTLWESDGGVFVVNPLVVSQAEATAAQGSITAWSNTPRIEVSKGNAATDSGRWDLDGSAANTLNLRAISDDGSTSHNVLSVTRSAAAVTAIASNSGSGAWQHTGGFSITGAFSVGSSPSAGTAGQVLTSGGNGAAPSWSSLPQAAAQADSTATDIAGLVADFNALLAKLRAAGLIAT